MSKTADEVKTEFRAKGITLTAWAKQHGFRLSAVNAVLRGQHQGHYGKAHEIMVALGMKDFVD